MKVPISWLKEYVDVKLPLKDLMWKMTEAGLTTESYEEVEGDIVLEVEVTANRPDWMSIVGVAREVAAIQNSPLKLPEIKDLPKKKAKLPIAFKNDFELLSRWTAISISGITIKPSPDWMQHRLKTIGLRPINNIVDITNYIMFELGIPMHAFDYDEIRGHLMTVKRTKGGENFVSVDELSYKLPKDAMVIYDSERLIDLCGIKGGFNSGIKETTKNLLIHCTIDNPVLTRKSSLAMGLRSDASAIYERGPNKGGTLETLKRAANLILELAGGEIASEISDLKKENFEPWNLSLDLERLEKVLGIKIPNIEVVKILKRLNLSPKLEKESVICTVPTYRGDLKIEEDLIEEVARIYGYNNFPKTLPTGTNSKETVPYSYDRDFEIFLKNLMVASGFYEVSTLSLISDELIKICQLQKDSLIKIANPVSIDYEYLRNTLIPSLILAIKLNANEKTLQLFEYNKVFESPLEKPSEQKVISGVTKGLGFRNIKGVLDLLSERLNLPELDLKPSRVENSLWHPTKSGVIEINGEILGFFGEIHPKVLINLGIKEKIYGIELYVKTLKTLRKDKIFKALPKFPAQIEDLTLEIPSGIGIGKVINTMKKTDKFVASIDLVDIYQDSYTFRLSYQNTNKTLNDKEVELIREKILTNIKKEYSIGPKK